MVCRTVATHKFTTRSGFKQYDVTLTKEQSVLTKILTSFEWENIQTQYSIVGYRTDLYFHGYKHAIEINENVCGNRDFQYEINR